MKRHSLLVLFFYCCSFVNPIPARAAGPLALLAPAAIGAAAFAISGTYFAFKPDHGPASFTDDGRNVTVPLVAYKPFVVAGAEKLLGRSVTAALDAKKAFDNNVLQSYGAIYASLSDFFGTNVSGPSVGDVYNPFAEAEQFTNGTQCSMIHVESVTSSTGCYASSPGSKCQKLEGTWPQAYRIWKWADTGQPCATGMTIYRATIIQGGTVVDQPHDYPPPPFPGTLPPEQVPALGQHLAAAAQNDSAIAQELEDTIREHPELWPVANSPVALPAPGNDISDYPPAQPISGADVNQWAQTQSSGAQQNYIDTLQDLVDSNPTNAELAAELAKAQAEQAQQEAEQVKDNFGPISDNPFDTPYDPGLFHIPTRFTAFLNNVQSSGLFSFSSEFFNSLPGGGSPIYTVEAGTYGTHTIDLSETMSTGLAVLKTVLLLLFGFLSIRVVILKR